MFVFRISRRTVLVGLLSLLSGLGVLDVRSQVIYDNTSNYLNNFVTETREYGDQVDLGGIARRLTQIQFEYYGRFATNSEKSVKVRLYTNERPYDSYRRAPTTLLFESDWMPIAPGFQKRLISGLDVLLPPHTVTFTVEFQGIAPGEDAGLLFYGPPTEGYSFNEFWVKNASGSWFPILYSNSDPMKRANVGLRLIAVPDVMVDQQQNGGGKQVAMRKGSNQLRYAQTFTANVSGQISQVVLNTTFSNAPVQMRILDTLEGRPGPNVLALRNILSGGGTNQSVAMLSASVYVEKGKQYAIELSTKAPESIEASYLVAAATNQYARGELWFRNEKGGVWMPVSDPRIGLAAIDAFFQVHVIPAQPSAELLSPRPSESFDLNEPILLRARHKPLEIGTLARMRYFSGTQEIGSVTKAPFEFLWTNAPAGEHQLRAVAEDSFRRPFRSAITVVHVRPAGAPVNDNFAQRVAIEGLNLRRSKPTATATIEANEPGLRGNPAGATVWWAWTAYDATPVTVSAQNSSRPGASVAVFTGTNLASLNLVTNGTKLVRFKPDPGIRYAISVDPAVRGDLVVMDIASADVRLEKMATNVFTAPMSLAVTGSSQRGITNVNLLAGAELLARNITAPARFTNAVKTSGFYNLRVAATDDRGIETISDDVSLIVRPENDAFANRRILSGDQAVMMFHPAAGTIENGEPPVMDLGYAELSSTWWSWQAPASGRVRVQVTSVQSGAALAVFGGTNVSRLNLVAQNAGTGALTFDAVAGAVYQIRVLGNYMDHEPLRLDIAGEWGRLELSRNAGGTVDLMFPAPSAGVTGLRVEYSSDLRNWKAAGTEIVEDRKWFSWRDGGVPATEAAPRNLPARFYRVVRE